MRSALLVLSLSLNVVLVAIVAWRSSAPDAASVSPDEATPLPSGKTMSVATAASGSADPNVTAASFDWRRASSDEIMAELRRAGAPVRVQISVAMGLVDERYRERMNATLSPVDSPRWRSRSVPTTAEVRAELNRVREEKQAEVRRLLGQDPLAMLAGTDAQAGPTTRFGSLPPETIARVARIESDYNRIRATQGRGVDAELLLEQELAKDLGAVLTPDEFSDYMAFNSRFAERLQGRLSDAELTDADYLRIYGAADRFRQSFRARTENATIPESSPTYRLEELAHLREAATDEVVAGIALRQDRDFQTIMKVTSQSEAVPGQLLDRYEAYLSFMSEQERIQARSGSREETLRLSEPSAQQVYHALTEGLDDARRTDFERTPFGRYLKSILSP